MQLCVRVGHRVILPAVREGNLWRCLIQRGVDDASSQKCILIPSRELQEANLSVCHVLICRRGPFDGWGSGSIGPRREGDPAGCSQNSAKLTHNRYNLSGEFPGSADKGHKDLKYIQGKPDGPVNKEFDSPRWSKVPISTRPDADAPPGVAVVTKEESPVNKGHRGPSVGISENRSTYMAHSKGTNIVEYAIIGSIQGRRICQGPESIDYLGCWAALQGPLLVANSGPG
jgi:hypothetical protein